MARIGESFSPSVDRPKRALFRVLADARDVSGRPAADAVASATSIAVLENISLPISAGIGAHVDDRRGGRVDRARAVTARMVAATSRAHRVDVGGAASRLLRPAAPRKRAIGSSAAQRGDLLAACDRRSRPSSNGRLTR